MTTETTTAAAEEIKVNRPTTVNKKIYIFIYIFNTISLTWVERMGWVFHNAPQMCSKGTPGTP